MTTPRLGGRSGRAAGGLLALLAYVPLLLAHPGRLPADTKLGLTLDPARLMGTALRSWDTDQFGGWVPHQSISYLWPSGPFYWTFERLGLAPWVVQRLWVGTILFLAGLGMFLFIRRRGYSVPAAVCAALAYQCSPYVLPYVSRTSVLLLPWAAVGWLMLLAPACIRPREWRRPTALFALVILTVGGVNLTATLMIAPAPILVLIDEVRRGSVRPRQAVAGAARIGGASAAVSLWWMTMLLIQGRYGADVLGYSETLQATSATSTSFEVLRQSGYWLSYVKAPSGATTTAAIAMMSSWWLLAAGAVLIAIWLGALLLLRFSERWLAGALLVCGVILAVGVHPITNASPLMSGLADASRSSLALAMRSSTRAVPLITAAIAISLAAIVQAAAASRTRWVTIAVPVGVAALVLGNLPSLSTGAIVDPGLLHDQRPPADWTAAASTVDGGDPQAKVIQLPGVESQVFDWGYTVDPPLAWTIHRPLITRDWLPLGSPGLMDLWYAFDDRLQDGTAVAASVAPIARFVGADTIWLAKDANHTKFASASADSVARLLETATDVHAQQASTRVGLYGVDRASPMVHAATSTVIVYGSGDGIVDATAAGLLDGTEIVRYAAAMTTAEIDGAVKTGAAVIVTDSNRKRARQWRGSQDVWGATESAASLAATRFDAQDVRFPLFAGQTPDDQSVAEFGALTGVDATSYGSPVRLLPQFRPAQAVDGDPSTAWIVGIDGGPTIGESLTISGQHGPLRTVAASTAAHVARIAIRRGTTSIVVDIAALASRAPIPTPAGDGPLTITILAVDQPGPTGFADLLPTPAPEVVRVPLLQQASTATTFSVVLTRLRHRDALGPGLSGPEEPLLRRVVQTPALPAPTWRVQVGAADLSGHSTALAAGCSTGTLRIDRAPAGLRLTADDVAAIEGGNPTWVGLCTSPTPLAAGTHDVASATTEGLDVDSVVLDERPADDPHLARVVPTVVFERGRDVHHARIASCPQGCWLVFGEGFSDGWQATSGNASLGGHTSVNGGVNAWFVTPHAGGTADISIRWTPQRRLDLVVWLSVLVILIMCGAALPWRRRQRVLVPSMSARAVGLDTATSSRARLVVGTVMMTLATALAVSPKWSLVVVPIGALAIVVRRKQVVTVCSFMMIGLCAAAIAAHRLVRPSHPGFGWPAAFERLHRPILVAVIIAATMLLVDEWHRPRKHPPV